MDDSDLDASVQRHIRRLIDEEHRLFERDNSSVEDGHRLAAIQVQLDQYWDLLSQRRAKREFGSDASAGRLCAADTVKKYIG